tara:strand:+ start:1115 stop:1489 length:375 start_codon:yes stop_codon:yes gene_type:complete
MPKYIVTGGEHGTSGINYKDKRYEPGDVVDVSNPKGLWLIKDGYLELASDVEKRQAAESKADAEEKAKADAQVEAEEQLERARNDKGHFIPDDPSTPDVNEAYVATEEAEAPEEEADAKPTGGK